MTSPIDKTDWSQVRHATGTCTHVPRALHDLCSEEESVRKAAYWRLDNHVIVQGDLYEAAPHVVRALVEILRGRVPVRTMIYNLLVELANGEAAESLVTKIDGRTVPVNKATVGYLIEGLDTYMNDLRAQGPDVRKLVAQLLLALSDAADLDLGEVQRVRDEESDAEVRLLLDELVHEIARAQ